MPEDSKPRWSSWVAVSPSLTPEQQQRIHALRAAREVIDVRPIGGPFTTSGTDFKDYLLMVVAQWIVDGELVPAAQFEADLDRWVKGQAGEEPDG